MRKCEEHTFIAHDGVKLFYRHWPSEGQGERKAVVLLHRGHEHSGRVAHIVEEIDLLQHAFFAWDMRAHGRSGGEQGSSTTMATFAQDLDDFVRHIRSAHGVPEENIAVVAQSLGAVIASAWAHDYAPAIRCMVLASPAFRVKLYVPFARLGLTIAHAVAGDFFVMSYVKGSALTHDKARAESYATDPLIKRPISVRVLLSLDQMAGRIVEDAAAIRLPVQMLLSGRDWVVHNKPQRQFFERLGSEAKELHTFEGFLHDTLGEKDRHLPLAKARAFLERQFERPASLAEGSAYTRKEYESLQRSSFSLKSISFAMQRVFLRTLGRLSDGIRLGGDTGYDSGASLDYVYRNQPSGITPVGRIIDWFYLNAPGWRGIRVRKQMIEALIGIAMRSVVASGHDVRVLDIAAGQGRYVMDGIARSGVTPQEILLRDFDASNVAAGRARYPQARFEQGDAFDSGSLQSITKKANVAVVSGLYELFPDNAAVRESLSGLAGAVEPGGYLLYTGQPWHPQLEMIARTLTSHRGGQPWIMRRRTQEELDELVRAAGFRKVAQRIDPNGLFTVSLAERI